MRARWALLLLLGCGGAGGSTGGVAAGGSGNSGSGSPQSCTPAATCPASPPSYRTDVAPVFQRRCSACHGPGGTEYRKHPLTSYAAVQGQRVAILDQVGFCLMPPPDYGALTSDERAAVMGWLACGAPDN